MFAFLTPFLLLAAEATEASTDPDGGWAAWLNDYGPWAVCVGLTIAVVAMARHIVKLHEDEQGPTPEQAKEIREAQAIKDKDTYKQIHRDMFAEMDTRFTAFGTTIADNARDNNQLRKDVFDELHDKLVPLTAAIEACTVGSLAMKEALDKFFNDTAAEKDRIITELARQKQEVGDAAMSKMEELYKQQLGMFEKVIGAAETLKLVNERLLTAEVNRGGDSPGTGD